MGVRQFLNRTPWLGWALAAALLVAGVFLYWRMRPDQGPYSLEKMSETVTIRCTETGDEWKMTRGQMERDLLGRSGQIDPNVGLVNPKTGRPTGFPIDDWASTVDRLNKGKAELAARKGRRPPAK